MVPIIPSQPANETVACKQLITGEAPFYLRSPLPHSNSRFKPSPISHPRSHARDIKVWQPRWPVPQLPRIPANPHKHTMTRRARIQQKQLEPPWRTDIGIRRRRNRARRCARARERREDCPLAHAIPVSAGRSAHEGELGICRDASWEVDGDRDGLAVRPVRVRNAQRRRRRAIQQIRRHEDLDAVFFWVHAVLGVGAGDDDAPVLEQTRFRVVQARDYCRGHDAHAAADGQGGVV
jgi:hypothetical protein